LIKVYCVYKEQVDLALGSIVKQKAGKKLQALLKISFILKVAAYLNSVLLLIIQIE